MSIRSIKGEMSLVGLIGWPVGHSISPTMQNAAFVELGMDWAYLPLPVKPGDLEQAIEGLVALNFSGCNVTIPHKQSVLPYMDEISDSAQAIGAVNTILIQNGKLIGSNTDLEGFLNNLKAAGVDAHGMNVLLLGAGGAARAVAYALARSGASSVVILNDIFEQAEALAHYMGELFPKISFEFGLVSEGRLAKIAPELDMVVNATPVGMAPDIHGCLWPESLPISANMIFYDLIYNPLETALLKRAKRSGLKAIDGLGMLVHQGALSFRCWTGRTAPIKVMRHACLQELEHCSAPSG